MKKHRLTIIVIIAIILLSLVALYSYMKAKDQDGREHRFLSDSEVQEVLHQLEQHIPQNAVVAASSEWNNTIKSIAKSANMVNDVQSPDSFHCLLRQSEPEALTLLKKQQATHLLVTSRDIYHLLEITNRDSVMDWQTFLPVYGASSVQQIKSDTGMVAFRYEALQPVLATVEINLFFGKQEPGSWILAGIYLMVDEASDNPRLQSAMIEFLSGRQALRFPPREIYCQEYRIQNGGKAFPCTLLIDAKLANPFAWEILCLSPMARRNLAVRLFLIDEPSENFLPISAFDTSQGSLVKVWEIQYPTDIIPSADIASVGNNQADSTDLKLEFPQENLR